jgi:hypothetical protein
MQTDTCTELLDAVRRFLDYLFDEFGFSVMAVKPGSADGRCLIVLSSGQCRFRIIFNRGDLEMAVGSLSAPVSWEDSIAGARQWYYLRSALDYVRGEKYPDLASLRKAVPFLTLEQKLAQAASDLKPDCCRVIQIFQADTFASRQRELEQFLREQSEHIREQLVEWQMKQGRQLGKPDT